MYLGDDGMYENVKDAFNEDEQTDNLYTIEIAESITFTSLFRVHCKDQKEFNDLVKTLETELEAQGEAITTDEDIGILLAELEHPVVDIETDVVGEREFIINDYYEGE